MPTVDVTLSADKGYVITYMQYRSETQGC